MTTYDIARSNRLPELAARIDEEHRAAAGAIKRGLAHAINAGELLRDAKASVPHGQWADWLKGNTALSERTAQRYMQLAKKRAELESKSATVADLTIRGACELIAEPPARQAETPLHPTSKFAARLPPWLEHVVSQLDAKKRRLLYDGLRADQQDVRVTLCLRDGAVRVEHFDHSNGTCEPLWTETRPRLHLGQELTQIVLDSKGGLSRRRVHRSAKKQRELYPRVLREASVVTVEEAP
jgi:Protein of unknown function (DUF3102)